MEQKTNDFSNNSLELTEKNNSNINLSYEKENEKEKNICEILDKNELNPIHYLLFYGFYEILDFIINNLNIKIDANILNKEGFIPLLLVIIKQNKKYVEILLSIDDINDNYLDPSGLHCILPVKEIR